MTEDRRVQRKQHFSAQNRRPGGKRPGGAKPPRKISGHEKMLTEVLASGENLIIENMRGDVVIGHLTGFDSYTITIREYIANGGKGDTEITIFKHAIESIGRGETVKRITDDMDSKANENGPAQEA